MNMTEQHKEIARCISQKVVNEQDYSPMDEYLTDDYDLSKVAQSGQILEVAVRNLSLHPNFNQADYEAKLDAFLAVLVQQTGRVAEYHRWARHEKN